MMINKDEKKQLIIKASITFFVPFIICFVFCRVKGIHISEVFIPGARKNDCLFYYKVVEGMVKYGIPKGFFGYNEAHAVFGSLPAWSPLIYIPWMLWGVLFGWTSFSAICCNIFYFSASLCFFVIQTRPCWKNIIVFFAILSLFPSIFYYLMNIQPESLIVSAIVIFYAFAFKIHTVKNTKWCLTAMFIVASILVLVRPYFLVLLLLPIYWLLKKRKKHSILIAIGIIVTDIFNYYLITKFLTCVYFINSYDTEIINKFLSLHWWDLIQSVFQLETLRFFFNDLKNAMIYFGFSNTSVVHFFIAFLVMLISVIAALDRENTINRDLNLFQNISLTLVIFSIILLRHSTLEGGRYLFSFVFAGCLVLSFNRLSKVSISSLAVLICFFMFGIIHGSFSPLDISIPRDQDNLKASVEYWQETFDKNPIFDENEFGYNNTIDWVYADTLNGEIVKTRYGELFAVPAGMGINCCEGDFIIENYTNLQSRYLAAPNGGVIDKKCFAEGWIEIGRTENVVVYKMDD